ncbi:TetR family transcriptional regulator C-terminal domain-containing protein [Streptomyces sp. NPDC005890]|uniref:TetR family transcriptional regulator C-terminal domain-containing protein n=1 Tax=Streptomyces sp. NPDC005890 TaxID=3154568 RepID=UPI0033E4D8DC
MGAGRPRDDRRRREWLVGVAYLIRMLANPELRALYVDGLPRLHRLLADLVRMAQETGDIAPDRDSFGLADSQGPPVVLGLRTPEQATAANNRPTTWRPSLASRRGRTDCVHISVRSPERVWSRVYMLVSDWIVQKWAFEWFY